MIENNLARIEQRRHQRYKVKDGVFAVLKSEPDMVGTIIDFSEGGLSFCYLNGEESVDLAGRLGIFMAGQGFYIKDLPVKMVSDFTMQSKLPFNFVAMRRCNMQFGELNPDQKEQLELFVIHHTKS